MFEITSIAAQDTYVLELQNADGTPLEAADGKPLTVTLYGPGSKAGQRAQAARTQRMMGRMARQGKTKLSAEDQLAESAEFLAAITKSFDGWAYKGANDSDAIRAAYADPSLQFIADQVTRAFNDWANFSRSCAKA